MKIEEVKAHLGKVVYLCDPLHGLKNIPYLFRAYMLVYGQHGDLIHSTRLEDISCGHCVIEARLEDVYTQMQN